MLPRFVFVRVVGVALRRAEEVCAMLAPLEIASGEGCFKWPEGSTIAFLFELWGNRFGIGEFAGEHTS